MAENKFRYTLTRKDLADIELVARLPKKVSIGLRVGVFLIGIGCKIAGITYHEYK